MTLANAGFNRNEDSTGTTLATHSVNSKEYPVPIIAGPSGHLIGSVPTFSWWVPAAVVTSANRHMADIYNSSASTQVIEVRGLWAIPKADVANAAVLSVEIGLYKTTAAGSAGTANAYNSASTSTTFHIITPMNSTDAGNFSTANITARFAPTSGTPAGQILWWAQYIQTEELQVGTNLVQFNNLMPVDLDARRLTLNPGEGLLIKQGTVASSGSLGFFGQLVVY